MPSIADLILEVGRAKAAGVLGAGQAWGNAISSIGQQVGAIPQQIRQQQAQDLQQQSQSLDLVAKQKAAAAQDAMDKAYQAAINPDGSLNRQTLLTGLPGHLVPQVSSQLDAIDKSRAELKDLQQKTQEKGSDLAAGLLNGVAAGGYQAPAFLAALKTAADSGLIPPQQATQHAIGAIEQGPQYVKQTVDTYLAQSPAWQKLATDKETADARKATAETSAQRLAAELPNIGLQGAKLGQEVTGTVPMTPAQVASNDIAKANLHVNQGRLGVEQNRLALDQQNAEAAPTLSPDALKLTAHQFAMTGNLPPMGLGKTGAKVRTDIINAAADEYKNLDLPSQIAAYKSNVKSLQNVTGTLDTLTGFENAGLKNLKVFTDLAAKLPDTGIPLLNVPLRMVNEKMLGSPDQKAAYAAASTAMREIARVTNDPKLSGVLSDDARRSVAGLMSTQDATVPMILSVAKVLQQDMANVHSSLADQKAAIQQRIATPPAGVTPTQTQSAGPKVGDVVSVGGKTVKITAIHPDGSFDGDPVKK